MTDMSFGDAGSSTRIAAAGADVAASGSLRALASELVALSQQQSSFGEVEDLKRVLATFQRMVAASVAAARPAESTAAAAGVNPPCDASAGLAASISGAGRSAGDLPMACWLLSGLLFQQGSRPLHRALLGAVKRLTPGQLDVFGAAVTQRLCTMLADLDATAPLPGWLYRCADGCVDEAAAVAPASAVTAPPSSVPLGDVLAGLLWLPAAHGWVRPVVAAVVARLAGGVDAVLAAADRGALHIAPGLMEEVLDAVGALYYLLQHHGRYLAQEAENDAGAEGRGQDQAERGDRDGGADARVRQPMRHCAVILAGAAMIRALKGRALVREALASAAVVLWASAQLPDVAPGAAAAAFGQGLFFSSPSPSDAKRAGAAAETSTEVMLVYDGRAPADSPSCVDGAGGGNGGSGAWSGRSNNAAAFLADSPLGGWLDDWLRNKGSSLVSELRHFSAIGRICSLKGLVTAMPKEASCASLWAVPSHLLRGTELNNASTSAGAARPDANPGSSRGDSANDDGADGVASGSGGLGGNRWHFLVDGALSYGCQSIRDAPDAHFKFHAACVLCFCVSKVLESWQRHPHQRPGQGPEAEQPAAAAPELLRGGEEPGEVEGQGQQQPSDGQPEGRETEGPQLAQRLQPALVRPQTLEVLMGLMWANLDEPLAQTARQLQDAFQLLLEVLSCQDHYTPGVLPPLEQFKRQVVTQLLAVPFSRKGRYASLSCMAERGCALSMLREHPPLISETLLAMQSDTTASAASSFLKALLAAARTESSANPELAAAAAAAASTAASSSSGASGAGCPPSSPWVALWRGALLDVLYSGNEKLRSYVSVHALPVVLGLEPASALELIRTALEDPTPEPVPGTSRVAALVAVLKAARGMGLVADLDALLSTSGRQRLALDPEALLAAAVGHASEAVRLDALELACVSFKMSDPPGRLELAIAARWLCLCMRSTAQGSRNKCLVLVTKLIARIRMAVANIQHKLSTRGGPAHPSNSKGRGLQVLFTLGGTTEHKASGDADGPADGGGGAAAGPNTEHTDPRVRDLAALDRMQAFMQWLTGLLVSGLYPGSPYERRFFALELLSAVLESWGRDGSGASAGGDAKAGDRKVVGGVGGSGSGAKGGSTSSASQQQQQGRMAESTSLRLLPRGYSAFAASGASGGRAGGAAAAFRPYCPEVLSANTVGLLLAGAVDSWDKLRQAASSCLMRLPTPLPGLASGEQLTPLLSWAVGLLWSPRARESDAGARLIKILYGKYVVECGWRLRLLPTPQAIPPAAGAEQGAPEPPPYAAVLAFLDAVLDLVSAQAALAAEDLLGACRRSLAHGPLLLLRYVVEDVPWSDVGASREGLAAAAAWAARALAAADAVVGVALPVLSRPQERNVGAEEVDADMGAGGSDGEDDGAEGGSDGGSEEGSDQLGPEAQVIITACWTTVKEVSLALATMVRHMPLPTPAPGAASAPTEPSNAASSGEGGDGGGDAPPGPAAAGGPPAGPSSILTCEQLRHVGELLVTLLFEMKHNGAVDKTSLALTAVTERVLRATAPELNVLPRPWLETCIRRMLAPGQSRDDIVRRSAGLPFAFGSLFLAEPSNAPKALLARGMAALLAAASAATSPALNSTADTSPDGWEPDRTGLDAAASTAQATTSGATEPELGSVVVVEGCEVRQVWPVVHAFNCLRHAFNDSHLAVDTSGYFAPAIQACLRALRSPAWEIRNSATLCFTALTTRVLGFKNDSQGETCRRAVSGAEFFERFPALHGFLLAQLREAAAELEAASASPSASAAALGNPHPGLYPVLIILSRLKASHIRDEGAGTAAAPQVPTGDAAESAPEGVGGAAPSSLDGADPGTNVQGPAGSAAGAVMPAAALAPTTATFMGALTPVAFTPLVRRCATAAPLAVRRLAARALAPLVAAPDVPTLLRQLVQGIPGNPGRTTAVAGTLTSTAAGAAGAGWNNHHDTRNTAGSGGSNALHGALLKAAALLDAASASGAAAVTSGVGAGRGAAGRDAHAVALSGGAADDLLAIVLPNLARGAWMADPRFGRSALGCGLLQAAAAALQLLPPGRCLEFRAELGDLAGACRQAVTFVPDSARAHGSSGRDVQPGRPGVAAGAVGGVHVFATDFPDPMRSQLAKQAAQLWLGSVLQCQAFRSSAPSGYFLEGLLHQMQCCLASYLYDTRAAALKTFVRYLTALNAGLAAAATTAVATPTASQPSGQAGEGSSPEASASGQPAATTNTAIAGSGGGEIPGADVGGKLQRLVTDLLSRPALLDRLVSEGKAMLWEAVASEPVHKVTRRALKALGLLHALSAHIPAAAAPPAPGLQEMDPITGEVRGASGGPAGSAPGGPSWSLLHPAGCACCDPRVGPGGAEAARAGLEHALGHVALVQRLLAGCKELEARCEALRCLGRALGSAMQAARGVAGAAVAAAKAAAASGSDVSPLSAPAWAAAVAKSPPLMAALTAFLDIVVSSVQPWQPEDWRLAGAEALAASQLLQAAVPGRWQGVSAVVPTAAAAAAVEAEGGNGAEAKSEGAGTGALQRAAAAGVQQLGLRGWGCVVTMLEDEDHAVRYTAARLAQAVIELSPPSERTAAAASLARSASWTSSATWTSGTADLAGSVGAGSAAAPASDGGRRVQPEAAEAGRMSVLLSQQPLYVEEVIRRLYPWLVAQYGGSNGVGSAGAGAAFRSSAAECSPETTSALVKMLCGLVSKGAAAACDGSDVVPGRDSSEAATDGWDVPDVVTALVAPAGTSGTCPAPAAWVTQARRLFDKEADNPHEEPLLTAQLASLALRALMAQYASSRSAEVLPGVAPEGSASLQPDAAAAGVEAADIMDTAGVSQSPSARGDALARAGGLASGAAQELAAWAAAAAGRVALIAIAQCEAAARGGGAGGSTARNADSETAGEDRSAAVDGWLGGFINHPEVFACAYRALLLLWALAPIGPQILLAARAGSTAPQADPWVKLPSALRSLAESRDVRISQLGPLLQDVHQAWGSLASAIKGDGANAQADGVDSATPEAAAAASGTPPAIRALVPMAGQDKAGEEAKEYLPGILFLL